MRVRVLLIFFFGNIKLILHFHTNNFKYPALIFHFQNNFKYNALKLHLTNKNILTWKQSRKRRTIYINISGFTLLQFPFNSTAKRVFIKIRPQSKGKYLKTSLNSEILLTGQEIGSKRPCFCYSRTIQRLNRTPNSIYLKCRKQFIPASFASPQRKAYYRDIVGLPSASQPRFS